MRAFGFAFFERRVGTREGWGTLTSSAGRRWDTRRRMGHPERQQFMHGCVLHLFCSDARRIASQPHSR